MKHREMSVKLLAGTVQVVEMCCHVEAVLADAETTDEDLVAARTMSNYPRFPPRNPWVAGLKVGVRERHYVSFQGT